MTTINLLPWREALRKERQKNFLITLGASAGIMLAVVGAVHMQIGDMISYQNARNNFIETQITRVEKQIEEIDEIEKEKQRLLARMNVIQQLQQGRPQIVHVFDELVKTLPEGVYLTSVKQNADSLAVQGFAQSNARVSAYMRNLDNSAWFKDPKLSVIEAAKSDRVGNRNSKFTLDVGLVNPLHQENEAI